ncbi:hypothetical protein KPH14_007741 [Odynerus spinipes]|uniref:Uncharacterized protein n=1 Tax=Odynerus spinipes TaxID=1348599 RepID=A0AAD9RJ90_9HYME|nr:hypothetical protein KPH14_007741 [Odynerus spinipes]
MDSTEVSSCKSHKDQKEQQQQQQPVKFPIKKEETKKKPEIVEKKEDEEQTEKREQPQCIEHVRVVPLMQNYDKKLQNFLPFVRNAKMIERERGKGRRQRTQTCPAAEDVNASATFVVGAGLRATTH